MVRRGKPGDTRGGQDAKRMPRGMPRGMQRTHYFEIFSDSSEHDLQQSVLQCIDLFARHQSLPCLL